MISYTSVVHWCIRSWLQSREIWHAWNIFNYMEQGLNGVLIAPLGPEHTQYSLYCFPMMGVSPHEGTDNNPADTKGTDEAITMVLMKRSIRPQELLYAWKSSLGCEKKAENKHRWMQAKKVPQLFCILFSSICQEGIPAGPTLMKRGKGVGGRKRLCDF